MRYYPFGTAAAFLIIVGLFALLASCGDAEQGTPDPTAPVVEIECGGSACTILVWEADDITTWRDGALYWFEDTVPPGRRYTNRDERPEHSLSVEACNEYGCTISVVIL